MHTGFIIMASLRNIETTFLNKHNRTNILTYSFPRKLSLIHVHGLVQYWLHSGHLNFPYILTGSRFLERPFDCFLGLVFFDAIALKLS